MWCWCMGGVCFVCVVCLVCFGLWSSSFACWVLWSVSSVWSLLSVVLCRVVISPRRPSSRLCRLVAVAVMRFLVHTPAWNNKRGLVAYFVVWSVFRFFGW